MNDSNHDVIIVGSGSAGLCAALWLSIHNIPCLILEKRSGPMTIGQADGVQCRTVEVFESFGLDEELKKNAYHVLEVAFWSAQDSSSGIKRIRRAPDTAPGLSHQPHLILNQAYVNNLLLGAMQSHNKQQIHYGYEVTSVSVSPAPTSPSNPYPITITACQTSSPSQSPVTFHAKYLLACDGAHSSIRHALSIAMLGEHTDSIWGVMDIYPVTRFPDIRRKCTLSSPHGSLLLIPREGGSLVRFYIELPDGTIARNVTLADLHAKAQQIFHPYDLEFGETYWWSAYAIGQRLAEKFHDGTHRVFLTGDACHTHSPKAGQGMNVSLQDGYNLGWKLAEVLQGRAKEVLLETYVGEREGTARRLIEFDKVFAGLFKSGKQAVGPEEFSRRFVESGEFTAGVKTRYAGNVIVDDSGGGEKQGSDDRVKGLVVGMRFPSAQVVRFCDARAMQLVRALKADGRWRIVVFAGDIRRKESRERLDKLARYLDSPSGPRRSFTRPNEDIDSFIETIVVLSGTRAEIEQEDIADFFTPVTGKWRMRDLHKVFIDDESYNSGHGHAYEVYNIDPQEGAIVVVRPDHYISARYRFEEQHHIQRFFERFLIKQNNGEDVVNGVNGNTTQCPEAQ